MSRQATEPSSAAQGGVCSYGAAAIAFIDTTRRRAVGELRVGKEPVQVAFDPTGASAHVTLRGENAVARIDVGRREVVAKTRVGRGPIQLFATGDGRLLVVANQGTPARPGHTVSLVSTASFREIAKVETGRGPHGVVVDPSSRRAYVTNTYSGTFSVLDLERRREVAEIPTGREPNGITFVPYEPAHAPRPIRLGTGGDGGHSH